ncbi:hypothetical protein GPECTOR_253g635 [Gonium pectorale]|uniref:Uncharacterized protein n=1 Tax=Gonium pectorale TaxID=33097 RepID=A0A150FW95_GONPE|nr:hypothetical protein GPECTOR_253g635 [Gonium pectorale]|eukprot:KXZ41881.1 hypothetical protein GPECTOR_253g635 [Gonium pectorale]
MSYPRVNSRTRSPSMVARGSHRASSAGHPAPLRLGSLVGHSSRPTTSDAYGGDMYATFGVSVPSTPGTPSKVGLSARQRAMVSASQNGTFRFARIQRPARDSNAGGPNILSLDEEGEASQILVLPGITAGAGTSNPAAAYGGGALGAGVGLGGAKPAAFNATVNMMVAASAFRSPIAPYRRAAPPQPAANYGPRGNTVLAAAQAFAAAANLPAPQPSNASIANAILQELNAPLRDTTVSVSGYAGVGGGYLAGGAGGGGGAGFPGGLPDPVHNRSTLSIHSQNGVHGGVRANAAVGGGGHGGHATRTEVMALFVRPGRGTVQQPGLQQAPPTPEPDDADAEELMLGGSGPLPGTMGGPAGAGGADSFDPAAASSALLDAELAPLLREVAEINVRPAVRAALGKLDDRAIKHLAADAAAALMAIRGMAPPVDRNAVAEDPLEARRRRLGRVMAELEEEQVPDEELRRYVPFVGLDDPVANAAAAAAVVKAPQGRFLYGDAPCAAPSLRRGGAPATGVATGAPGPGASGRVTGLGFSSEAAASAAAVAFTPAVDSWAVSGLGSWHGASGVEEHVHVEQEEDEDDRAVADEELGLEEARRRAEAEASRYVEVPLGSEDPNDDLAWALRAGARQAVLRVRRHGEGHGTNAGSLGEPQGQSQGSPSRQHTISEHPKRPLSPGHGLSPMLAAAVAGAAAAEAATVAPSTSTRHRVGWGPLERIGPAAAPYTFANERQRQKLEPLLDSWQGSAGSDAQLAALGAFKEALQPACTRPPPSDMKPFEPLLGEPVKVTVGQVERRLAQAAQTGGWMLDLDFGPRLTRGDFGPVYAAMKPLPSGSIVALRAVSGALTTSGVEGLVSLVWAVPGIQQTLLLSNCGLGDGGLSSLEHYRALGANNSLTSLNLGGNSFGDRGVQALTRDLASNRSLTRLVLSACSLGDGAATALAPLLATHSTLTHLDISHNSIGWRGARALADALAPRQQPAPDGTTDPSSAVAQYDTYGYAAAAAAAGSPGSPAHSRGPDPYGMHSSYGHGSAAEAGAFNPLPALRELVLDGNPLGQAGCLALMRLLMFNNRLSRVSLAGVTLAVLPDEPVDLDPQHPNGHYTLNLADPEHRQASGEGRV